MEAEAPTVLVVEDDEHDQAALIRTLTEAGFGVEAVATGAEAIARCRRRTYEAITLDLLLPDMSGLDVLRVLRTDPNNSGVPVVVVTVVTERGAVAGFAVHDLLAKPLDGVALLASLERAGVWHRRSGQVLVVDDDPGSLKLMATTLGQLGYASNCVANGEAGLQAAREAPPLAVVLDLLMPEMDGFEFLDRLRQVPSCRRVPVIVWTIKDLSTEEYARLRTSVQGVVTKGGGGGGSVVEELRRFLAT
jgi:CheY-like chemotaxis protein